MRRREFVKLIAGAAIAAPCEAMALTPVPLDEKDPLAAILLKALQWRGYRQPGHRLRAG